jgi:hypothetical protein
MTTAHSLVLRTLKLQTPDPVPAANQHTVSAVTALNMRQTTEDITSCLLADVIRRNTTSEYMISIVPYY